MNIPGPKWHSLVRGLQDALLDDKFTPYYDKMIECMSNLDDTNILVIELDQCISQAGDRVFTKVSCVRRNMKGSACMIRRVDSNGDRPSGRWVGHWSGTETAPACSVSRIPHNWAAQAAHIHTQYMCLLRQIALTCGTPLIVCAALAPLVNLVIVISSFNQNISILL